MRKIEVVSYDPKWPELFQAEAALWRKLLGNELRLIAHVGSTAIPGMAAKPTIDIAIGVHSIFTLDMYIGVLESYGYLAQGEQGIPGRRFFIKSDGVDRVYHVHVFDLTNGELWRHIYFKRYLQGHSEQAQAYAELKQQLAQQNSRDVAGYIAGKEPFVEEIEKRARAWVFKETLTSERLLLRPFTLQDAKAVQKLAGDKAIADGTYYIPHPYTDGMAEQWITSHRASCESGSQVVFAVTLPGSDELVGAVGLFFTDGVECGYWIGRPYWDHGYATEATGRLLKYAFEDLGIVRIYADSFTWNKPSVKVMKKLGMRYYRSFEKYVDRRGRFEAVEQYVLDRGK
ncbi:MAG: GNAT family N-acetyltransferase [Gammaproteobacteria bacterium]|nr:GNAT family N-acetyltransferase [Gammaproteobacteria bacterium]